MNIPAPIRLMQRGQRLAMRGLVVVMVVVALWVLLSLAQLRSLIQAVFSAEDLRTLLNVSLMLLLLLIPITGIYSVLGQFAFWEGWLNGLPQPRELPGCTEVDGSQEPRRFVVYLDGIHQKESDHPPQVSRLLDAVEQGLDPCTVLIKGLEAYTVLPVSLAEDRGSAWFWQRLFVLQDQHPNAVVRFCSAFLVQANNVIKVGISSDRRYGPISNYLLSLKILHQLQRMDFSRGQGQEVVLLGYSGGGEMAMGVAEYLHHLCRSPIRILTFCGVFSGNQLLNNVHSVTTVVGTADPVAAFGNIAYPGRSPLLPLSNWNRARRRGQVRRVTVEGMTHNGRAGPFSDRYMSLLGRRLLDELVLDDLTQRS